MADIHFERTGILLYSGLEKQLASTSRALTQLRFDRVNWQWRIIVKTDSAEHGAQLSFGGGANMQEALQKWQDAYHSGSLRWRPDRPYAERR